MKFFRTRLYTSAAHESAPSHCFSPRSTLASKLFFSVPTWISVRHEAGFVFFFPSHNLRLRSRLCFFPQFSQSGPFFSGASKLTMPYFPAAFPLPDLGAGLSVPGFSFGRCPFFVHQLLTYFEMPRHFFHPRVRLLFWGVFRQPFAKLGA